MFISAQCAFSKTLVVMPQSDITLQSYVNKAAPYDTLLIKYGLYNTVDCTITRPIVIIGDGLPVLDIRGKGEGFIIASDDVTIVGLKIINTNIGSLKDYSGIKILQSNQVRIQKCQFENTFFGIYLSESKNCIIENNSLRGLNFGKSNTGNAIHLWKCDSITIQSNYSAGHRDGIYLEFVKHSWIANNVCEKNFRYGLHFMFSHYDSYWRNTFQNNGTGVAVMYSKGITMIQNSFINNWGDASYGLLLKDIVDGEIRDNIFSNNTMGVTMEGSNRLRFSKNIFRNNGYALRVWANCTEDTFVYNRFHNNTFDASTNGELTSNLFDYNYWDKYEGYDIKKDGIGDIPYHPVSLYSMLVQQMPQSVILMHSFIANLLDRAEKSIPSITPKAFVDNKPLMRYQL